jgi:hypothetical protein
VRNSHGAILLDPQQHVDHVLLAASASSRPPLLVVLEDIVHEPDRLSPVLLRLVAPWQHSHELRRREEVAEVKDGREVQRPLHHLQERGSIGQPVAEDGAHRRVGDELPDPLADVDWLAGGRGRRQRRDEAGRLVLADATEHVDALRAEELRDEDPPEQPPVVAVGREDDPHPVPRVRLVDAGNARALLEAGNLKKL